MIIDRGRTLLVTADEGYGDFIQAARFIPGVARQGRVVVSVPPPLWVPLLTVTVPFVLLDVVPSGIVPPVMLTV